MSSAKDGNLPGKDLVDPRLLLGVLCEKRLVVAFSRRLSSENRMLLLPSSPSEMRCCISLLNEVKRDIPLDCPGKAPTVFRRRSPENWTRFSKLLERLRGDGGACCKLLRGLSGRSDFRIDGGLGRIFMPLPPGGAATSCRFVIR